MPISSSSTEAFTAINRFGLGPKPDAKGHAITHPANDPRGALKSELQSEVASVSNPSLAATKDNLAVLFEKQQAVKDMKRNAGPAPDDKMKRMQRNIFLNEAQARFARAYEAPIGFMERLVWFWSNHFCVSTAKSQLVMATAGSFEREAIRPHVLGKFSDMLLAVETHPAMLLFLDNRDSIGPNSRAGQRRQKGLNENLAREILELHTLGVNGGYTQADVTSFAKIITGWSVEGPKGARAEPGTFFFNERAHEPGAQTVLGKSFSGLGIEQGLAVLDMLARHPATAKHIAWQFARHFVADEPPQDLVHRLAATFQETGGDLRELAIALVEDDMAWSTAATKIRSPQEFLLAASRALGLVPEEPKPLVHALEQLGQPLWRPPGPNGFGDTNAVWTSAEGLKVRLDYAVLMGRSAKIEASPVGILDACCGPSASPETRQAVSRAESAQQAIALLLMSPEFQRR